MQNILITSAGRRVSLVRAFQKELKAFDSNAKVFACDANPSLSAACHVADGHFGVPRLDRDTYIDNLIFECRQRDIEIVIPTIDTELMLLARNRDLLLSQGVNAIVADSSFVKKCRDKRQIHDFFSSVNVNVAREFDKQDYILPLFLKPVDGSRSVDTYLIRKESELTQKHFDNPKMMFLEYLDHDQFDEFTCDMYYDKTHQLKCAVPRQRIEIRDGEVYKAVTRRNILVDYIRDRLNYVEGAIGCLTSQFFVNKTDQSVVAIEINPRFGGGYPLSYLAGANFPKWIIQEYYCGETLSDQFDIWEKDLLMIRYDDEVLVNEYRS
jgi:carbamoyl-phosphate synthase large subunit